MAVQSTSIRTTSTKLPNCVTAVFNMQLVSFEHDHLKPPTKARRRRAQGILAHERVLTVSADPITPTRTTCTSKYCCMYHSIDKSYRQRLLDLAIRKHRTSPTFDSSAAFFDSIRHSTLHFAYALTLCASATRAVAYGVFTPL